VRCGFATPVAPAKSAAAAATVTSPRGTAPRRAGRASRAVPAAGGLPVVISGAKQRNPAAAMDLIARVKG